MLRANPSDIGVELAKSAEERNVQIKTLKNYTRWPIAVMRDLGWTKKAKRSFRNSRKSSEVHQLTDAGRKVAEFVSISTDLRLDQLDPMPFEEKAAVSIHSHYRMLERAEFDIEPVNPKLNQQKEAFERGLDRIGVRLERPLLFSPFQTLSVADIGRIFPLPQIGGSPEEREFAATDTVMGRGSRAHLFVEPRFAPSLDDVTNAGPGQLEEELLSLRRMHTSADEAVATFVQSHVSDTHTQFYPLVSELFRALGFESETSRVGVNYQRWDCWVCLGGNMVPIEIKSPTEELALSTKAIRQALENKVVLLSRGGGNSGEDDTTLIVGYHLPSERGEMSTLIDDVFETFNISIGVIDLSTLVLLAIRAVTENLTVQVDQIRTLRGYLHV